MARTSGKSADRSQGLREEVLNVKLAELLSRSGLLSVPESILSEDARRRLPDVIIGDYWGVRVVLEGRVADRSNVQVTLENDCLRRIEEGIAAIAIAIRYPRELRYSDWDKLEQKLRTVTFRIRVFSEAGAGEWIDSDLEGLSAVLRRAYESLVNEDLVNASVEELRQSIEAASRQLAGSPGTAGRLRNLLVVPRRQEADQNNE
jgi:hypothetical protein